MSTANTKLDSLSRLEAICIGLSTLPALVVLWLINRFGVNIPNWDEWGFSVAHYLNGDLLNMRWSAFWRLNLEHRVFITPIIDVAIAHLTNLNIMVIVYFNFVLTILIAVVLCLLFRSKISGFAGSLMLPVITLLIFSLIYWPHWIDPRNHHWHLSILTYLVGIYTLDRTKPGARPFAVVMVLSIISALSFFSGNLMWLFVGAALWFYGYRHLAYYIVWFVLAGIVAVTYTLDFLKMDTITNGVQQIHPVVMTRFFLTYLGSPLVGTKGPTAIWAATAAGAIATSVVGYAILQAYTRKIKLVDIFPWLCIALWVMLNGAFAAYGRGNALGVASALAVRYIIFSSVFWVSIVALAVTLMVKNAQNRWLSTGVFTMVALAYVSAHWLFLSDGNIRRWSDHYATGRECLHYYEVAPDTCLIILYPAPWVLRTWMPQLIAREVNFLDQSKLRNGEFFEDSQDADLSSGWTLQVPDEPLVVLKTLREDSGAVTLQTGGEEYDLNRGLIHIPAGQVIVYDLTPYAGQTVTIIVDGEVDYAEIWTLADP